MGRSRLCAMAISITEHLQSERRDDSKMTPLLPGHYMFVTSGSWPLVHVQ